MGYTPPFLYVSNTATVTTVKGTSSGDLTFIPNLTQTRASLTLQGNGNAIVDVVATGYFAFQDGGTNRVWLNRTGTDTQITSKTANDDLFLVTTGTGVLKFGTYTAGAATDSTGYITIKDAAGNTRKLMVQA